MKDQLEMPMASLQDTSAVTCTQCGESLFEQALILRKLSAILSGTGKPAYIPIPVFKCAKCNHVNEEFLPVELKKEGKKS